MAVRVRGPDANVVGHQCCREVRSSVSSSSCSRHQAQGRQPLLLRAGSFFEEYSSGNNRVLSKSSVSSVECPHMASLKPSLQLHFHMPHRPHRCPLGSQITKRLCSFSISSHIIFGFYISNFAGLSMSCANDMMSSCVRACI